MGILPWSETLNKDLYTYVPASIGIVTPETYAAAGDKRKQTPEDTSSGVPILIAGICARTDSKGGLIYVGGVIGGRVGAY